ncbi:glycosyltransferase family 2 protein [Aquabacterium sp.]|uniref:glycosyltransferase family 2 protein n=1 Tax=Aquabacterium sp. TaxID=1872578 RepID=UPI0025B90410|nr:glycosyltransferase family 2 protein [Aquabacterium sp.]
MQLTILMPCLNEERTVGVCVKKARSFLERSGLIGEVLISDNGSTDRSCALAEASGARVIHATQRGYGAALMAGISEARGSFVIMGDADDSYDFEHLEPFVAKLSAGAQLVMGNRFKGGIAPGAMPLMHRYLGNPVLSWLGRLLFGVPIGDFHCGLRGFSRADIQKLTLVSPGMEFATEMVAKAALRGLIIDEVPTTLRPDGRDRPPHLRTWRDGWRHLLFMLLFSPKWLFLWPGVFMVLAGGVLSMLLFSGPVFMHGVGLSIHSMLYACGAVVLGCQLIQFSVLVRWIAVHFGVLPDSSTLKKIRSKLSIEANLIAGASMLVGGVWWTLSVYQAWAQNGYSMLDPEVVMRSTIPALTLMLLGFQACASVLLAGAIRLAWQSSKHHG